MMQTILGTEDSPEIIDLALGSDGAIVYTDGDGVFLVNEDETSSTMLRQPGDTRTVAISTSGIIYYNFKEYIRSVDPLTGASVGIKNGAGFRKVRDMDVGPMGMVFYTDGYSIFKVHPRTGVRTILLTPNDMNSLAFGPGASPTTATPTCSGRTHHVAEEFDPWRERHEPNSRSERRPYSGTLERAPAGRRHRAADRRTPEDQLAAAPDPRAHRASPAGSRLGVGRGLLLSLA